MLKKIAKLYGEFCGWRIRVIEKWVKNFRFEAIKLLAGGRGYVLNVKISVPRGWYGEDVFPAQNVMVYNCLFETKYAKRSSKKVEASGE
jgi:hypothetical protein